MKGGREGEGGMEGGNEGGRGKGGRRERPTILGLQVSMYDSHWCLIMEIVHT